METWGCPKCARTLPDESFGYVKGKRKCYCRECCNEINREYRRTHEGRQAADRAQARKDPAKVSVKWSRWYSENRALCIAKAADYRAARLRACPSWADKDAIQAVYEEAVRLTKETGILHEVDHEVPLQGRNVSGLHVHWNLRAITKADNRTKSNRHIP